MARRTAAIVLEGAEPEALLEQFREDDKRAFVVFGTESPVVVFPEHMPENDLASLSATASRISANHDSVVLATSRTGGYFWLRLFESGELVLDYDSAVWDLPWASYARRLSKAFSQDGRWLVLRSVLKSRAIRFFCWRQWLVLRLLELPTWIATSSYSELLQSQGLLSQMGLNAHHT